MFSVSAAELVEGLSPVALAAYTDLTLLVLCSVQLRLRAGQAPVLNATDRYRLAEWTAPGTWGGDDAGVLVLAKPFKAAAAALERLARHALVSVGVEEGWLHVGTDSAHLSLRRVEAEYPRVEALWPAQTSHSVQVDVAALAVTAKRLSALIERNGAVRLDVDEDGVYLGTLDASTRERVGERQEFDSRPPRGVAFTPEYLAEAAAHFPGTVTVAGTRASGGWVISDQDGVHRSYLGLLDQLLVAVLALINSYRRHHSDGPGHLARPVVFGLRAQGSAQAFLNLERLLLRRPQADADFVGSLAVGRVDRCHPLTPRAWPPLLDRPRGHPASQDVDDLGLVAHVPPVESRSCTAQGAVGGSCPTDSSSSGPCSWGCPRACWRSP